MADFVQVKTKEILDSKTTPEYMKEMLRMIEAEKQLVVDVRSRHSFHFF